MLYEYVYWEMLRFSARPALSVAGVSTERDYVPNPLPHQKCLGRHKINSFDNKMLLNFNGGLGVVVTEFIFTVFCVLTKTLTAKLAP
jgi:hypothetical protein